MKIQISIKGLVDYMTGSPAKQRTIIKQHKYPTDDDSHAKIIYYREAKERIQGFHKSQHESDWLLNQSEHLASLAKISAGQVKSRLEHNVRAINQYKLHFADRKFEVLEQLKLGIIVDDVAISVTPDLHVKEKGKEKIIKFHFGSEPLSEDAISIYSQAMFEASQLADLSLPSSSILLLDISSGTEHKGARLGSRMRKQIEAACLNISAIWDKI